MSLAYYMKHFKMSFFFLVQLTFFFRIIATRDFGIVPFVLYFFVFMVIETIEFLICHERLLL